MASQRMINRATWVLGMVLTFTPAMAHADMSFSVTWDSSSLVSHPADGPYYLDFSVVSAAAGIDATTNVFTVSNIQGATLAGAAVASGSATGSLPDGFSLTAGDTFFNDIFQQFTPGDTMSFLVTIHEPSGGMHGPTPDSFAFSILVPDATLVPPVAPLWTTAPDTGSLFVLEPTLTTVNVLTYGSDPTNSSFPFDAPTVTAVPEPGSLALGGIAVIGLAVGVWRRRRHQKRGA